MSHSAKSAYRENMAKLDQVLLEIRDTVEASRVDQPDWSHVGSLGHWVECLTRVSISMRSTVQQHDQKAGRA